MHKRRMAVAFAASFAAALFGLASAPAFAQGTTPSNTALSADNNPAVTGQEVTFTATVTDATGLTGITPTGTVEFQNDGVDIPGCSAQSLDVNGMTQCQVPDGFAAGSYSITAIYSGDETFAGSTGSLPTETVDPDGTSTNVTSNPSALFVGEGTTLTATVTPDPTVSGEPAPTGTVEFQDGGVDISGCSAVSLDPSTGTAQCPVPGGLPTGTDTITAIYSGDANYSTSTGTLLQTVSAGNTATSVAASPHTLVATQPTTLTANIVVQPPAAGTPTGSVDFENGGVTISGCGAQPVTSNSATCPVTGGLPAGSDTISAIYSGDGNFNTSTGTLLLNVKKDNSSVNNQSNVNPTVSGESVTFTATVSAVSPGTGTPTGNVVFAFFGKAPLPSCSGGDTQALSGGVATCTTSFLPSQSVSGQVGVEAEYQGDSNFNLVDDTNGTVEENVNPDGTTTGVVSAPPTATIGQPITLTATVSANAPGSGTPSGFVTFSIPGSVATCTGGDTQATSGGVATCDLSAGLPSKKKYKITATYEPSPNYNGSKGTVKVKVT
ncbi:MAG TPA: Ig-like domain-containing protein [Acidimicrobiales bacterium]|nr:Ig-like domain-containing protein [Acidimicrobiales bacterium]